MNILYILRYILQILKNI